MGDDRSGSPARRPSGGGRLDWVDQTGDALLHFHAQNTGASSPGVMLLAAILMDAAAVLAPGAFVDKDTRSEAVAWVNGEIESAPLCSFREVCVVLDLDEDRIRTELLQLRATELPRRLVA